MTEAMEAVALRPLDLHGTANALQHALELRRAGLAGEAIEAMMKGVVAELLADALIAAGYVVSVRGLTGHAATGRHRLPEPGDDPSIAGHPRAPGTPA